MSDKDFETAVTDEQFFIVEMWKYGKWHYHQPVENVLNAISKNGFSEKVNRTSRYNLIKKEGVRHDSVKTLPVIGIYY